MAQVEMKAYPAYDYESISVGDTAVGLTAEKFSDYAAYGLKAFLTVETGDIRFRIDGTAPTSGEGHLLKADQNLTLEGYDNLSNFKAIKAGTSGGVLKVTYFKG